MAYQEKKRLSDADASVQEETPLQPFIRPIITAPSNASLSPPAEPSEFGLDTVEPVTPTAPILEDLRILVIGDRLFTDTLLAHRLRLLLPSASATAPSVLSIHTTSLPQPRDVRFLRWIEEKLSRGQTRRGVLDYSRFLRPPTNVTLDTLNMEPSIRDRWMAFRTEISESRLGWSPRSWTASSLIIGIGRGSVWLIRNLGRGLVGTARLSWVGFTRLAGIRQRAARTPSAVVAGSKDPSGLPVQQSVGQTNLKSASSRSQKLVEPPPSRGRTLATTSTPPTPTLAL